MKVSKESSSRLCPLGDVPPSAARWGVSGVASRVSDPARVSGGSRCSAPPWRACVYAKCQVCQGGVARAICG